MRKLGRWTAVVLTAAGLVACGGQGSPLATGSAQPGGKVDTWSPDPDAAVPSWGDEADLPRAHDAEILPYFLAGAFGSFVGEDGIEIAYVSFAAAEPVAKLVILNGRTESLVKYAELVYSLRESGYSLYLMDHRGQGFSGRMLDDPERGHVDDFDDYVTDLTTFIDTVVGREDGPLFALAHSMGGAILTQYVLDNPEVFVAISASAPMYKINSSPFPEPVALALAQTVSMVMPHGYALMQKPFDPDKTFEQNRVTHSRARFRVNRDLLDEAEFATARMGGATWKWVREAIWASISMRRDADELETPTLVMQAEADKVVVPDAQTKFCDKTPRCTRVSFAGAYHELLMETDEIRDRAITWTLDFFEAQR